jgi:copper chaperone
MAISTVQVQGMTCDHCVAAVRGEVERLEGVTGVDVDLDSGTVTIDATRSLGDAEIAAAIDEAGYELA